MQKLPPLSFSKLIERSLSSLQIIIFLKKKNRFDWKDIAGQWRFGLMREKSSCHEHILKLVKDIWIEKCQFSQAVYLGVYAQSGAIPPLHCVMKNSNIFFRTEWRILSPLWNWILCFKMRWFFSPENVKGAYRKWQRNLQICGLYFKLQCFLFCIPPYSWFHDVLT